MSLDYAVFSLENELNTNQNFDINTNTFSKQKAMDVVAIETMNYFKP